MKKNLIALLLAVVMAAGSIGSVSVMAAETTAQEAELVQEETDETAEEETDVPATTEEASESETVQSEEEVSIQEEEKTVEETEQTEEKETAEGEAIIEEEAGTKEEEVTDEDQGKETDEPKPEDIGIEDTEVMDASIQKKEEASAVVASGSCGNNANWTLTGVENDYTLTISGSGEISSSFVPWLTIEIYQGRYINSVVIEDGITRFSDTFANLSYLRHVTIADTVEYIGEKAFYKCSQLESIKLPNSLTSIEYCTFSDCSSLTSVTIPDGVTSIMSYAFSGCSSLTSLTIPDSVTGIKGFAFSGCSNLTTLTIGNGVTSIEQSAFRNCSSLTSVTIPDSVTEIQFSVFSGCSNLTTLTIGNGLTSIGSMLFSYCSNLTSIYFSGNAPTFRADTFYDLTTTAYYPANDPTWTDDVRQDYDGTITWVPWDPNGSSGGDEGLKIVSTIPANGDMLVDHALNYYSIQFDDAIDIANDGYAYLFDVADASAPVTKALISKEDGTQATIVGSESSGKIDRLEIRFPFCLELGHEYYVKIDADCIIKTTQVGNSQEEVSEDVYFKGITDDQSWRFKICSVDYMHFDNPTDKIHESVYHVLFTPIKASFIQMLDDGTGGTCYGWSYAVGAKANGYTGINGFGKKLMLLEKNSVYETNDFTFLEYIHYLHLYQNTYEKIKEKNRTENKYNEILNAIKASIDGTGPKIIINVYKKKNLIKDYGHAVYPLSVLEENDSEVQIRVINPNREFVTGSHFSTLILKKKNGVINSFQMEDYDKRISYNTIDDIIDTAFSMASACFAETNMVHSSVLIENEDYYELEPCGNDEADAQTQHLYWYEGTQTNTYLGQNEQFGITDGFKDISVTVSNDAETTLDLDQMTAVVEGMTGIPSEFEISYTESTSLDDIKTTTVTSVTSGTMTSQETSDGLVIQSPVSEEIVVQTDDLTIKATTDGDDVLIKTNEDSSIEVLKDPDNDGTFDEQVEIEILSGGDIRLTESMLSGVQEKVFTGNEIKQDIILKNGDMILIENTDYTVTYENNINPGKATVTITGIGSYTGTITKNFMILPGASKKVTCTNLADCMKVEWEKVPGGTQYKVYRDNKLIKTTSGLVIGDKDVRYEVGKKFTYKVVATNSIAGDSTVSRTGTYYRLLPVGVKTLTSPSAGKLKVTYGKCEGCYGYVVRYGKKSDMSDSKTLAVKGANTLTKTLSVEKGKTYYVQVRTYMLVNGVRYFSTYSRIKSVKVK